MWPCSYRYKQPWRPSTASRLAASIDSASLIICHPSNVPVKPYRPVEPPGRHGPNDGVRCASRRLIPTPDTWDRRANPAGWAGRPRDHGAERSERRCAAAVGPLLRRRRCSEVFATKIVRWAWPRPCRPTVPGSLLRRLRASPRQQALARRGARAYFWMAKSARSGRPSAIHALLSQRRATFSPRSPRWQWPNSCASTAAQ